VRLFYKVPTRNGKPLPFASTPSLLLGNIPLFFKSPDKLAQICNEAAGSDGAVLLMIPFVAPIMVLVSSKEDIKEVLGAKVTMASERATDPMSEKIFGKALFAVNCSNGDWKRQHRVCMRGFGAPRRLEDYSPLIDARAKQMVTILDNLSELSADDYLGWKIRDLNVDVATGPSPSLAIRELFSQFAMKVISDVTIHGVATPEELMQFHDDIQMWIKEFTNNFLLMVPGSQHLPIPSVRRAWARIAGMQKIVDDVIARSQAAGLQGHSLVEELIRASIDDGQLSEEEIRHNVFGFIIAGNTTTSDFLTTAVFMLARHPCVQSRLVDEMDRLDGGLLDAKAPYLDAFLNEVLRLYTPGAFTLDRTMNAPTKIGNIETYGRTSVAVNNLSAQRNEAWGADAWEFRPERWLDGSISQDTMSSFFNPFGNGVRHCIGKNLSLLEVRTALHTILRRYTFKERDSAAFEMVIIPGLAPKPGLHIIVEKRA